MVPRARRDMDDRDVIEMRGALKGVEETGSEEVERRSCV